METNTSYPIECYQSILLLIYRNGALQKTIQETQHGSKATNLIPAKAPVTFNIASHLDED